MPEDVVKKLSKRDLRDLVEFLAQREASNSAKPSRIAVRFVPRRLLGSFLTGGEIVTMRAYPLPSVHKGTALA